MTLNSHDRIYVAGHKGMVGSAIVRELINQGYKDSNILVRTRSELDLCDQQSVKRFFQQEKPSQVYLAAAKVGGIYANNEYPAEFIYQNLVIQANVVHEAWQVGVKNLLFLGSTCIYPKLAEQPIKEEALLTGDLEPTNEPYAIAKIAGIKLCESYNRQYGTDYRSIMPTNLYGVGDNYHPENSHVIPALIRRFHEAKVLQLPYVNIWGTGLPRREFLYVDDMAKASVFLMNLDKGILEKKTQPMRSHINVGCGQDIAIAELALTVSKTVGYQGEIRFDPSKPDGVPRKWVDSSRIHDFGWRPQISLVNGLKMAYTDFVKNNTLQLK